MSKNILFHCITVLLATLFIAVMPTEAESAVYDDTVRLHILANSDTKEDQEMKLILRDAVLREYGAELAVLDSAEDARCELLARVEEIEEFCAGELRAAGYCGSVAVEVTDEWFETRKYGDATLPAGYYTALCIYIGEGEGQNWWCVMFPPMCLDIATEGSAEEKYTDEERALINGGGYRVKFKILELISSAFS